MTGRSASVPIAILYIEDNYKSEFYKSSIFIP